ncbi:hypothetical protein PhaeoP83_04434 (plasmid) [Phaeobacter inhibens]|jgi:hypothetical protein|uniref:Uncharacterized protein n=2 Tax=Phaeobacter TaxID=302485 RepID=A0AAN1GVR3_9RHOB|nr:MULTISPECIES: hypothetical protein [Phaeobacter]ATG46039.1 hypothetical protein PhaeoP13_04157 [Phaeobacter piscinae]AUQ52652.1 hypothetical protein PhaeoP83_04434 [Phaeobacter inhibens]AUQ56853.1 hypothetical protein PhaeoP92_04237 [Phaeobacter inhibens]AUQ68833.1 hypothetical protein PhaeoP78_04017 [Phaeobacter inhibens]AUQ80870.1 hypothetical protein PhaeoP74_04239 [Phaeobacter inhibens]
MDQAQQHELDMISDLRSRSVRWKIGALGGLAITFLLAAFPFFQMVHNGAVQPAPPVLLLAGFILTGVCVWQTVELRGEAARRETRLWG